jgi:hypothetical protein
MISLVVEIDGQSAPGGPAHCNARQNLLPNSQSGSSPAPETTPRSLMILALAIGALLGALAPATIQDGFDGSLVLAGYIDFPAQAPMNHYFLDSWTIIHQIGALMLRAGLDQAYVNELIFLFPCTLMVCAYATVVYCFSGQYWLSLFAAPLYYLTNPLAKFFASPDYSTIGLIWDQASDHTFGTWAHVGAVWVIGCIAAGRNTLAGFSAMVLIAVHPVLGAYMVALLAVTLLIAKFSCGANVSGFAKGAVCGAGIVVLSFAAYLETRPEASGTIDHAAFAAYMDFWDTHRSHAITGDIALRITIAAVIAIAVLSVFLIFARPRSNAALLTAGVVMLAVIASTIAYFAEHLVPDLLPEIFLRAGPGRLLNVQAFISTPMALGLALYAVGQAARDWRMNAVKLAGRAVPSLITIAVAVELAGHVLSRRQLMSDDARTVATLMRGPMQDDAPFWSRVRAIGANGLVLTSRSTSRPALYYGHLPTALNVGSIDFIPYLPQTAGPVARIIEDGYGVPFADPPAEFRHAGALPPDGGRAYWAQLTPTDWCRMSHSLGVVAVLAPNDWDVKLTALAAGKYATFYEIRCE